MEPRPDGRGKERADGAVGDDREAAMEPRPDGRGKTTFATGSATKQEKPQWSPGLMAGGSRGDTVNSTDDIIAAMEPRPDGRGKGP